MPKRSTELFIARRIGSFRGGASKGVMVRIAVATTAISVAVMIVAIAVIAGFRTEISGKVTGFGGQVRITALDYSFSTESAPMRLSGALEDSVEGLEGFAAMMPYVLKGGLLKTADATQGVVLKGVDGGYDRAFWQSNLLEGELPRVGDSVRHKDILVSLSTARAMKLAVDDRVEMLFVNGDRPPHRDRFRVSGIYSSGLEEMDKVMTLTDITNVQRLYGWEDDQISGYEIYLDDARLIEEFARQAYARTVELESDPPLMVRTIYGDNPQLFDWLKTHDVNAAVIVTIMLVVAFFSLLSALLIILLERTSMIGTLKALGMKNGAVRRIFLVRSAYILVAGLAVGDAVGIGFALLQRHTSFIKLDEAGYFLSAVPIELGWEWIVALNVGTLVVLLALLVVPTNIVSRISPATTIRYE
ncbi:MAG: ABC transporter permease [Rikenellaceae bacterium]|jgi:lipoprotein-releasing system permease protein|nr:ABC transporter permease [Rikenellaceae bacterium]